jgi:ADP-ribose pyrophosphatase
VLHATICRDVNHCVLASGCTPAGVQDLDPTEFMHVQLMTPDELDDLVRQGRFLQLSHAHAWLRWGGLARECGGGAR